MMSRILVLVSLEKKMLKLGRCSSSEFWRAADAGSPEGAPFIQADTLCKFDENTISCLSALATWDPVQQGANGYEGG